MGRLKNIMRVSLQPEKDGSDSDDDPLMSRKRAKTLTLGRRADLQYGEGPNDVECGGEERNRLLWQKGAASALIKQKYLKAKEEFKPLNNQNNQIGTIHEQMEIEENSKENH